PTAQKRLPYDPEKDLTPVALVAFSPSVLAVHPSLAVRSMKDFVEYTRNNPGKVRYGVVGVASNTHLTGELLRQRLRIEIIAVPGIFATAGSPAPMLQRVASETTAVLQLPETKSRWRDLGIEEVEPLTGAAFGDYMRREAQRWRDIATIAGVKEE